MNVVDRQFERLDRLPDPMFFAVHLAAVALAWPVLAFAFWLLNFIPIGMSYLACLQVVAVAAAVILAITLGIALFLGGIAGMGAVMLRAR